MLNPYMAELAGPIVERYLTHPNVLDHLAGLCTYPRSELLSSHARHFLPGFVLARRTDMIEEIARAEQRDPVICLAEAAGPILAAIFQRPTEKEQTAALAHYLGLISAQSSVASAVTPAELIADASVDILVFLVIAAGSPAPDQRARANQGLERMCKAMPRAVPGRKLTVADVLEEHLLAVVLKLSEQLNDMNGRSSMADKQKMLAGLAELVRKLGGAVAAAAPQIVAILSSTLPVPELAHATMLTWDVFAHAVPVTVANEHVGALSAALVRDWPTLSPPTRTIAVAVLQYQVIDLADQFGAAFKDVADLSGLEGMAAVADQLKRLRDGVSFEGRLEAMLDRVASENDVVEYQGLHDLRSVLVAERESVHRLTVGDAFSPVVGRIVSTLVRSASRVEVSRDRVRDLAFDCLGILGAVDPDRFVMSADEPAFVVLRNFRDRDESISFALYLIQHVLAPAYRSSNDTRHQHGLAYAIQELMRFCGFTIDVVTAIGADGAAADAAKLALR